MLDIASHVDMEILSVVQYVIDGIQDKKINAMPKYKLKEKLSQYDTMKPKVAGDVTIKSKSDKAVNTEFKRCYR